jgi:hypothetical protein
MKRILSNRAATCLVLALFQLWQVSTVAQERILSGGGPEAIPIQEVQANRYNNDLRPTGGQGLPQGPEDISTAVIIKDILQDRYLRRPVAVVTDTAPPFLYRAKALLQAAVSTSTSVNMVLIPYNSTGIGPVQTPTEIVQLQKAVHELRPTTIGFSNRGGVAFYSILKATEKVPYDSAILLFTGRAAEDEDLAQIASENLASKRCKLYVLWLDPPPTETPGIETLYVEVARRSGGEFFFTSASDFSQAGMGQPAEMEDVTEVTLAMRLDLTGQLQLPIQVDRTVTSLLVTIQGPVGTALLRDPFGNEIDLRQDSGERHTVLIRDENILSVQFNTSVAVPGRWTLKTAGADADSPYNVIVRGTSSLYFNASTNVVPSVHANDTKHEGSVNPNIQLQLRVPKTIATIQNVSLVNKDGNELKQLQYNRESDIPEIEITEHKLSTEPVYLRLIASTNDGDVVERLVELQHQTQSFAIPYTVDVLPQSTFNVPAGQSMRLVFNVTNHLPQLARLAFTCQVRNNQFVFTPLFIMPIMADIQPGQSIPVTVTGTIRNTQQGTPHIVQFAARPFSTPNLAVNRAVFVYVGVPPVSDTERPTIRFSVRNNCWNVPQERCLTATWNMEGTVQDSHSGLVSVTSNPVGVEFLTPFVAGTTSNVPVAYTASCCRPIVDIRATDARGNFNTQRIHANAGEWLLDGEIAAIVLGVLLFIFIIIVIVLAILLFKKNRAHTFHHSSFQQSAH